MDWFAVQRESVGHTRADRSLDPAQFGLKVLEQALEQHLVVSQKIEPDQALAIDVRDFAGDLQTDLLDKRKLRRVRPRIAGRRDELHADLDLVGPVRIHLDDAFVLDGSEIPRVLVHRRDIEVVLEDRVHGGLPYAIVLGLKVRADGELAPEWIPGHEPGLKRLGDLLVGTVGGPKLSEQHGRAHHQRGYRDQKPASFHSFSLAALSGVYTAGRLAAVLSSPRSVGSSRLRQPRRAGRQRFLNPPPLVEVAVTH